MTIYERRQAIAKALRPFDVGYELIRVGDFGDGGYLVPDDLSGIRACFSPGVSKQASFELDMAKRGIPSFMADASVAGPAIGVPGAEFPAIRTSTVISRMSAHAESRPSWKWGERLSRGQSRHYGDV
jgi:hypothetical protein